jgi:hypothetical protein
MTDRNIFVDFEIGGDTKSYLSVHDLDVLDSDKKGREKGLALRKRVSPDPKKADTVTWSTKKSQTVKVDFGSVASSPFTVVTGTSDVTQSVTLMVTGGASPGRYKYTLTLYDVGNNVIASEDPQIIVDDSTSLIITSSDEALSSKVSIHVPVTISGSTL